MESSWLRGLKTILFRYFPPLFYLARYLRKSIHERKQRRIEQQIRPICDTFQARYGNVVQHGPFADQKYLPDSHGSDFLPKLIGSYEAELHAPLETALQRRPSAFVDVGCAEGYYAVGLLRRCPWTEMFAFDIQPASLDACQSMAQLNGVADRLHLAGECNPEQLQAILRPGMLIICDCEGYELELLDPAKAPALRQADILVELHDHLRLDQELTPTLLARFQDTHTITRIGRADRRSEDYPCLEFLPPESRRLAVHEDRTSTQEWALLLANARSLS